VVSILRPRRLELIFCNLQTHLQVSSFSLPVIVLSRCLLVNNLCIHNNNIAYLILVQARSSALLCCYPIDTVKVLYPNPSPPLRRLDRPHCFVSIYTRHLLHTPHTPIGNVCLCLFFLTIIKCPNIMHETKQFTINYLFTLFDSLPPPFLCGITILLLLLLLLSLMIRLVFKLPILSPSV
jgi:hypothetical protein